MIMTRLRLEHLSRLLVCVLAAGLLSACSTSSTKLPYFTDIPDVATGKLDVKSYAPEISPDDELMIFVTSENPVASSVFNLPIAASVPRNTNVQYPQNSLQTYKVNQLGDIQFPILGTIHVAGMTTVQLQKYLTERISKEVENPLVTVSLENFTVRVGGEVAAPKEIRVDRERFTILDALAAAGDLTPYGERSNVLLVREKDGKLTYTRLDLNSSDLLTSPFYYLQPNDYIYVTPNKVRQANAKYNSDNAYKLQVASIVVSTASVIASLVIALLVK